MFTPFIGQSTHRLSEKRYAVHRCCDRRLVEMGINSVALSMRNSVLTPCSLSISEAKMLKSTRSISLSANGTAMTTSSRPSPVGSGGCTTKTSCLCLASSMKRSDKPLPTVIRTGKNPFGSVDTHAFSSIFCCFMGILLFLLLNKVKKMGYSAVNMPINPYLCNRIATAKIRNYA